MNMLLTANLIEIEDGLINGVCSAFSNIMGKVQSLLTTNPKSWAVDNGIWNTIETLNNAVISVSCQLVVLFFLIGFVESSTDMKEELNLEKIFKLYIRIGITQFFVVNSLAIVNYMFEMVTGLVRLVSYQNYELTTSGIGEHIYNMHDLSRVVFLFPTLLFTMLVPACAAIILVMALMRLFRIYIAIPYGSLAFSTIASGSRHFEHIMPGFVKYMLSVLLEAFSLSIALSIGFGLLFSGGHGFVDLTGVVTSGHLVPATLSLLGSMINAVFLVVLCKMSQDVAGRALWLDRI